METKTETAHASSRDRNIRTTRAGAPFPEMKRSHWIVFFVIAAALALLVLVTIVHVMRTNSPTARRLHAATPVETVPVSRQTLEEVIGGSGSVEQSSTVQLTTQLTADVLEVPVKIGDLVKKGDLLVKIDDRLIQTTVNSNRQYVEASQVKIRDEQRQVDRYTALE